MLKNPKSLPHNIQAKRIKPSAFGHHHTLVHCCNLMTRCGILVISQHTILLLIFMIAVSPDLHRFELRRYIDTRTYVGVFLLFRLDILASTVTSIGYTGFLCYSTLEYGMLQGC